MNNALPYNPPLSKEWLENYFKKDYYKKPYDRFMWWRSYTPKNKPLTNRHPLRDRILNGDFDYAPYKFEAMLAEHRMNEKFIELNYQEDQWREATSVEKARIKRLMEDYNKEEPRRLEELKKAFLATFKIDNDQYEQEVTNFSGSEIIDFYFYIEEKYGTYWKPLGKIG